MNRIISKIVAIAIMVTVLPLSVYSFDNEKSEERQFQYSDTELLGFVDSNREISEKRRDNNASVEEVVNEQNLTLERFNQISRAAQIGALQSGTFSDEEINAFNVVGPKISQLQRDMQLEIQVILDNHELNSAKYQEILRSYQQDQDLQAHVREIMRERAIEAAREARRRELEEQQSQE